jgi:hypothetical protein
MQNNTYTSLAGEQVTVPCLEWLEDGITEDGESCARYYVGEEYGDSQSVWLDEDMFEVIV